MAITIKKVTTKSELKKFIRFNYRMYKDNPYYVDLVTKDDIPNIHKIIDDLYSNPLNDSEYIREKIS